MQNSYSVDVLWCEEADVFVGTSQDIPGLTLEAESLGGLLDAVFDMVPSLIEQNLGIPEGAEVVVTVRVRQPMQTKARSRQVPVQSSSTPKPRYVIEEDLRLSYA